MNDIDPTSDDLRPPSPRARTERHADDSGLAPVREGLPPSYRMRADRHYVDLLASSSPHGGRSRTLPVSAFDAPAVTDVPSLVPLIDSVRQHGVLQPLIVQESNGSFRVLAGRRRLAAAIAAGLREVPCSVHAVDEAGAEQLRRALDLRGPGAETRPLHTADAPGADDELARAFHTIGALAELSAGHVSELTRGLTGNLLRAEIWRASHLQQAARVARAGDAPHRTAFAAAALIDRTLQGFLPERRLRHVEFAATVELPPGHLIVADERMVATAVTGALLATLALVEGVPAPRVSIAVSVTAVRALSLAVAQDHVRPSERWVERAFDQAWADRPGGVPALLSMLALQRVASAHGGECLAVASARGSRLAITLPAGA